MSGSSLEHFAEDTQGESDVRGWELFLRTLPAIPNKAAVQALASFWSRLIFSKTKTKGHEEYSNVSGIMSALWSGHQGKKLQL